VKRAPVFLLLFLILLTCSACSSEPDARSRQVYTSVYPVYYLTDRIGAGVIDVELMMPPSADPHNWEPSPKQIAKLENCTLFIYNGAGLEPWASKIGETAKAGDIAVFEVASALRGELLTGAEDSHDSDHDPHFWLDPVLAKDMASGIRDALVKADPDNENLYNQNFSRLEKDLEDLHNQYESVLARCKKKEFVVTHQAFGYLAKRYGLEQIPIMGISAESEPTPARLAELARMLEDLKINYVFAEPFTGSKVAQALASETGAKVLELNPIGGLTEEEMEAGADYLSLMQENLEQLKVALEYEP